MMANFNCLYTIKREDSTISDGLGGYIKLSVIKHPKKRDLYDFFDSVRIRVFIKYATSNGTWNFEIYRKKTKKESKGELDWKMIRIGNIVSLPSRSEAETKAFTKAFEILEERLNG